MRSPVSGETVFLDRDGTINVKAPAGQYITTHEEFRVLPGAVDAVQALREAGLRIVVVTNQRAIARGLMSAEHILGSTARWWTR